MTSNETLLERKQLPIYHIVVSMTLERFVMIKYATSAATVLSKRNRLIFYSIVTSMVLLVPALRIVDLLLTEGQVGHGK